MAFHEITRNNEGKIELIRYGQLRNYESAEFMAMNMTDADLMKLLDTCGGDFSQFSDMTAKAIALKATLMLEKQDERKRKAVEYAKQRAERVHSSIMNEIEEAVSDIPIFTPTIIQQAIIKNGGTPHTRQMYSSHLRRACYEEKVKKMSGQTEYIEVIYANGHIGKQRVNQKNGYKFV